MTDEPGWAPQQPPPSPGWGAPGGPAYGQQYGQPPYDQQQYGQQPYGQQYGAPGWGPPAGGAPAWEAAKPGVIPLRPLGVGEILDGAISTIRAKPKVMLGLSALVAVATQIVIVPITWLLLRDVGDANFSLNSSFDSGSSNSGDLAASASSLTAGAVQGLVTLFATLLLTGILMVVLSRAVLGQPVDTAQAWQQARPRLPALLGMTLLLIVLAVLAVAVGVVPGILLAVAGSDIAAVVALLVGIPLVIVVVVYFYVAFALAPAAIVLERQGVVASLRRSRRLVQGGWWRTFGIILLVNVIAQIVSGVLSGIFTFGALAAQAASTGFDNVNPYALLPLTIGAVGTILASTIAWPFTAVSTALVYVDRRMRREGLDIELARAAGVAGAVPSSATPGTPLQPPTGYHGDQTGPR